MRIVQTSRLCKRRRTGNASLLLRGLAFAVVIIWAAFQPCHAQTDEPIIETWDCSPYRIQAWLTIEPRGSLSPARLAAVEQAMLDFALPAAGVTWDLQVSEPPEFLRSLLVRSLESFTADDIVNSDLVLIVNKDLNSKEKERLDLKRAEDMAKEGVRLGLGDPAICGLGRRTLEGLGEELGKELYARATTVRAVNSQELVEKVVAGDIDAAICRRGDANAKLDKLTLFELRWDGDSREMLANDKLIFINVVDDPRGFRIQTRELDGTMRHLGPVIEQETIQPEILGPVCAVAMTNAFQPIARIEERRRTDEELEAEKEKGRRNVIDARVRAGGLIQRPECISHIEAGDVLLPLVRRNDKYGNPTVLEAVAWTFLQVVERDGAMLDCDLQSGTRGGLAAKRSARTQQIAIKANPKPGITTIFMESRSTTPRPLIGYEVYAKDLQSDDMTLIGHSDWRGAFDVPPVDYPLRLLYVKNGGFVMAKLPTVPGLFDELTVQMNDDERRLEAEAFVKGIQTTILDTVAQTKVMEIRIRKLLNDGKHDEAAAAAKDLLALPTRDDLNRLMNARESTLRDPNPITQKKIDLLFKDTRELMAKYLDAKLATNLAEEVQRARKSGG